MLNILLPIALLAGGMAAGGLMIATLGGAPMLVSLPVEMYVPVHKLLVTRFDPFMPLCLLTALLCDAVMAVIAPTGTVRILAIAGAVLYASVMTVSLTKNVPINKWVATLDPANLPANWASVDPRWRWKKWNSVRTVFAVAALVVNVSIAGVLV